MAPGVPGGLIDPSTLGTIAGAGIPPPAASSPGMPSSGAWSYMPPKQDGFHPSVAHAGSSGLLGSKVASMPGGAEATAAIFAGSTAPSTDSPAIAATAALFSVFRASQVIVRLICRSFTWDLTRGGLTFAMADPVLPMLAVPQVPWVKTGASLADPGDASCQRSPLTWTAGHLRSGCSGLRRPTIFRH